MVRRTFASKSSVSKHLINAPWLLYACISPLALLSHSALSQNHAFDIDAMQWYGGASVGESRLTLNTQALADVIEQQGGRLESIEHHKEDTGFKLLVGASLNDSVALELGYFRLGVVRFDGQLAAGDSETTAQLLTGYLKAQGIHLDVIGRYAMTSHLALTARLGTTYNETNTRLYATSSVASADDVQNKHDMNYKYGAGLEYTMTPAWLLRLEMERYRLGDLWGKQGDFNLLSLGVVYRYGNSRY